MDSVYSPTDYGGLDLQSGMSNAMPGPSPIQYDTVSMRQFFVMSDSQHGSKPPRARRKSSSGSEQVKHRRTRSGCFTCRTRRVKCDETHPICERCAKGSRICKYPEVIPSKSGSKKRTANAAGRDRDRDDESSLDELEEEDEEADETPSMRSEKSPVDAVPIQQGIPGGRGVTRRASWTTNSEKRGKNRPPVLRKASYDPTPSPSTYGDGNSVYTESSTPTSPTRSLRHISSTSSLLNTTSSWSDLPTDIGFYFTFHKHKITCYHYMLKADHCDFLHTVLLEEASKSESLMYAVAAFASLRYTAGMKDGRFQTFLEYYNTAVSKLRENLVGSPPSLALLLTILQLASFEEYLGDWGNLVSHRNAAAKVIETLYTPETFAETAQTRMIYTWFSRFDIFAAMMAGHATFLGRDWSEANRKACLANKEAYPGDFDAEAEYCIAVLRDTAIDSAMLSQRQTAGLLTLAEFDEQADIIRRATENLEQELFATIAVDPVHVAPVPENNENYSPFLPGTRWKGPRWLVGLLLCDLDGLKMMLRHHTSVAHDEPMPLEQAEIGKKICSHIAAIMAEGETPPPGWILPTQAPIGLAALWVPDEPGYRPWIRKVLGMIELEGFIFPIAFRTRLSQLWGDPSLQSSWSNKYSSTLDHGLTIRQLVDINKDGEPQSGDTTKQEIREMRALLSNMRVSDGHWESSESPQSANSADSPAGQSGSVIFRPISDWGT